MAWLDKRTMFGHEHSKQMFEDGTDDGDEEDFYGLLSNANGETRAITGASEKVGHVLRVRS